MKIDVKKYSKFIVALVAAVTSFGVVAADGEIDVQDIIVIATAVAGAFGVRQVTNRDEADK